MFDCFRRQSGKLSLNQGHHLWVSLNIKEALLLITFRKIFVCSRRSPGNFHSNSLQLWPLQRQLQPLTLQGRGFVNKYIIIIVFPISNFNKVYSPKFTQTHTQWPKFDPIMTFFLSFSPSLLNVSVYFRNNKTVNKTSRFFSFSLIMHRHLFWGVTLFVSSSSEERSQNGRIWQKDFSLLQLCRFRTQRGPLRRYELLPQVSSSV